MCPATGAAFDDGAKRSRIAMAQRVPRTAARAPRAGGTARSTAGGARALSPHAPYLYRSDDITAVIVESRAFRAGGTGGLNPAAVERPPASRVPAPPAQARIQGSARERGDEG